jgi:hypothetical protein
MKVAMESVTYEPTNDPAVGPTASVAPRTPPVPWDAADEPAVAALDLDQVRDSLRSARQQLEGALAVLRERGALQIDAAEAFARTRGLCHRAERHLASVVAALGPEKNGGGRRPETS